MLWVSCIKYSVHERTTPAPPPKNHIGLLIFPGHVFLIPLTLDSATSSNTQKSYRVVLSVQEDLILACIRPDVLLKLGHGTGDIGSHAWRPTHKDARSSTEVFRKLPQRVRYIGASVLGPPAISSHGWQEGKTHEGLLKLGGSLSKSKVKSPRLGRRRWRWWRQAFQPFPLLLSHSEARWTREGWESSDTVLMIWPQLPFFNWLVTSFGPA